MNIERQIEFDKIKEMWMKLAVTEEARERIRKISVFLSESELRKHLRDTTDSRNFIEKLGTPPLQNITEIKEIMDAAKKGDCLTPYQLERVEKILVSVKRLKDYLERGKDYGNSLAYYEENLDAAEELREEISRQIRGGAVDDYASRELCQLRGRIAKCEEQMREKAEQTLHVYKQYMADSYCTIRSGRICIPVKKEYRAKIAGSVIDKSSTGNTLFIEPSSAAKYFEEIQTLKISEENEVYRILYTLTAMTADWEKVIEENTAMIARLDFIFSKGKLSMDMQAFEPSVNTDRRIFLKDARHPLMEKEINVPLQFEIGEHVQGIVITGPNTGGNSGDKNSDA